LRGLILSPGRQPPRIRPQAKLATGSLAGASGPETAGLATIRRGCPWRCLRWPPRSW